MSVVMPPDPSRNAGTRPRRSAEHFSTGRSGLARSLGPLVRMPEREPYGRWQDDERELQWPDVFIGPRLIALVPRTLLLVTVVLVAFAGGASAINHGRLLFFLVAAVAAVWQELWLRWRLQRVRSRIVIATVQWLLSAVLVVLHPLAAFFAWSEYLLAATFFTGGLLILFVTLCGVTIALGQVGGITALPGSIGLYLLLVAVNAAVALGFMVVLTNREEALRRRDLATQELLAAQQLNATLQQELLERARQAGVTSERSRIAREIHDTVAQGLVGVITQLEAIDARDIGASAGTRIDRSTSLAREALGEARRAVDALSPASLQDHDLIDAVRALVAGREAAGLTAAPLRVEGWPRTTEHDAVLIRICQEALSNVDRHALASTCTITLTYLEDEVLLDIADDGKGFDPASVPAPSTHGGHGLPGMTQRVQLIGGRLSLESERDDGTVVSAAVPG